MTGGVLTPGNAALILFGVFFGLLLLRVPVAFALGIACLPMYYIEPRLDTQNLVQETFNAFNSFMSFMDRRIRRYARRARQSKN